MTNDVWGFTIKPKNKEQSIEDTSNNVSFAPEIQDDGALVMQQQQGAVGAFSSFSLDLDAVARTEAELVTRYRRMSLTHECENAIDEVVNQAIVASENGVVVDINLDKLEQPEKIKNKIREEFQQVLRLLRFDSMAYETFRRWYIDGRMYFHVIVDEKNIKKGSKEYRYLDPRKIKKVREIEKVRAANNKVELIKTKNEHFVYSEKGFYSPTVTGTSISRSESKGLKISKDAIVHVTSGLLDEANKMVLSHLHKAIKPLNQLRILEDAVVIYRIARAPERRIFNIEVGGLSKIKAEQHVRDMMQKHKNRLVYDAGTGEMRDDRKFMTMLEDFWLPTRNGQGNQITTLPPGQNLGEMEDVKYFQRRLFESLKIPVSRLEGDTGFNIGRSSEISRDEVNFQKWVDRLRLRFSILFNNCLEKELVFKGVLTTAEWNDFKRQIAYDFTEDSYYAELRDIEILKERLEIAVQMEAFVGKGKYYSHEWVRKNIFKQSDEDIKLQDKLSASEEEGEDDFDDDIGVMPGGGEPEGANTAPPGAASSSEPEKKVDDKEPETPERKPSDLKKKKPEEAVEQQIIFEMDDNSEEKRNLLLAATDYLTKGKDDVGG